MLIVVALGGNALLRRGEPMTIAAQRANVAVAAAALAPLLRDHQVVLTHGNGPQVGMLALQNEACADVAAAPLPEAIDAARRIGARRSYFTHICHDLSHAGISAGLPPGMELAYDGLMLECA